MAQNGRFDAKSKDGLHICHVDCLQRSNWYEIWPVSRKIAERLENRGTERGRSIHENSSRGL